MNTMMCMSTFRKVRYPRMDLPPASSRRLWFLPGRASRPGQVAMTGEVTLRGRILPGRTEREVGARRSDLKNLLPRENKKDVSEIPKTSYRT